MTENCWKLIGKPESKVSGNQTNNTQQPQQQQKPGNQGSGGKKKGNRRGKGKKDKGKVSAASDTTWTPEYNAPKLLPGKPGEASTSAVTASWIEEEVLDWQNDADAWEKAYTPPKPSYRRHSFSGVLPQGPKIEMPGERIYENYSGKW